MKKNAFFRYSLTKFAILESSLIKFSKTFEEMGDFSEIKIDEIRLFNDISCRRMAQLIFSETIYQSSRFS